MAGVGAGSGAAVVAAAVAVVVAAVVAVAVSEAGAEVGTLGCFESWATSRKRLSGFFMIVVSVSQESWIIMSTFRGKEIS